MQDPSAKIADPEHDDRRRERRRTVFLQADLCRLDGTPIVNCAIQDTSRSGCKILCDQVDLIPDEVLLTIRGLNETFVGRIMWRAEGSAGIQFLSGVSE